MQKGCGTRYEKVHLPENYKIRPVPEQFRDKQQSLQWCMAQCLHRHGGPLLSPDAVQGKLDKYIRENVSTAVTDRSSTNFETLTAAFFKELPRDYLKAVSQGRPAGAIELFAFAKLFDADFYVFAKDESGRLRVLHGLGKSLGSRAKKAKKESGRDVPVLRVVLRSSQKQRRPCVFYCYTGGIFDYIEDGEQGEGDGDGTGDNENGGDYAPSKKVKKTIAKEEKKTEKKKTEKKKLSAEELEELRLLRNGYTRKSKAKRRAKEEAAAKKKAAEAAARQRKSRAMRKAAKAIAKKEETQKATQKVAKAIAKKEKKQKATQRRAP